MLCWKNLMWNDNLMQRPQENNDFFFEFQENHLIKPAEVWERTRLSGGDRPHLDQQLLLACQIQEASDP